jgi:hypothetical protein
MGLLLLSVFDKFIQDVLKVNIESFYLLENMVDYDLVFDKTFFCIITIVRSHWIFWVLRETEYRIVLELLRQFHDRFEIVTRVLTQ